MNVTRSQREHPLNRKATELLRQMKVIPSDEALPIVQLLTETLGDDMPDGVTARLHRLDSVKVIKQVTPALHLTDLDDTTPYQAALLIAEVMGLDELVDV